MSITLKEISQFFLDLVNKTFIPVISSSLVQHQRLLQIWKQASQLLAQIQKMNFWNLQSFLRNISINQASSEIKQSKQYIKNEHNRNNNLGYMSYDNKFDRKQLTYQSYSHQQPQKTNPITLKTITRQPSSQSKNKSYKYTPIENQIKNQYQHKNNQYQAKNNNKSEIKDDNIQGFQKLILSFRKLVNNFESNHKKLLREDQNFKENYKEGFLSTH